MPDSSSSNHPSAHAADFQVEAEIRTVCDPSNGDLIVAGLGVDAKSRDIEVAITAAAGVMGPKVAVGGVAAGRAAGRWTRGGADGREVAKGGVE
jgi:hypothetical protein